MAFLWRRKKRLGNLDEKHRDFLLREFGGRVAFEVPMKDYTSLKVGGPADCMVFPRDAEELKKIIAFLKTESLPHTYIGYGTNILVRDGGIRGITVNLRNGFKGFSCAENGNSMHLSVGSGTPLAMLVKFSINGGWSGFEPLAGIPGSVGGAVMMNAGTKEGSIEGIVERIVVLDDEKEKEIRKESLKFSYRSLSIPRTQPIIRVHLKLKKDSKEIVSSKIQAILNYRRQTQPRPYFSAGCIFKNPQKIPAGRLIDELGLKGVRVRGAKISEKHANFIINLGNATARDILTLIELIKGKVQEERNITLEPEVIILGEE